MSQVPFDIWQTDAATKRVQNEQLITVDGSAGEVILAQ